MANSADVFWSVTNATDTAMLRVVMAAVEGQCYKILWPFNRSWRLSYRVSPSSSIHPSSILSFSSNACNPTVRLTHSPLPSHVPSGLSSSHLASFSDPTLRLRLWSNFLAFFFLCHAMFFSLIPHHISGALPILDFYYPHWPTCRFTLFHPWSFINYLPVTSPYHFHTIPSQRI